MASDRDSMSGPFVTGPFVYILSQTSVLLAIIGAWLYWAGWAYVKTYLGRFQIGISQSTIPGVYFLPYGADVFVWNADWLCVLLIALGVQAYFLWRLNVTGIRSLILILFGLLALFAGAAIAGQRMGSAAFSGVIANVYSPDYRPRKQGTDPPYVQVLVNWPASFVAEDPGGSHADWRRTAEELADGCHVLVWGDVTAIYLLRVRRLVGAYQRIDPGDLPTQTLRIPMREIRSYKMMDRLDKACIGKN